MFSEDALPNISPPGKTKSCNVSFKQALGKVELVSSSCDACCSKNVSTDKFIQRGVTIGSTTSLQKKKNTARQVVGALRRTNTVICAGIYFTENSSKSN